MKMLEELGISPAPWTNSTGSFRDGVEFDVIASNEALREICETVEGENVHFTGASAWFAKARAALEKAGGAG